jgi:pimeloyl-ACP methyl ester carboxylesterase
MSVSTRRVSVPAVLALIGALFATTSVGVRADAPVLAPPVVDAPVFVPPAVAEEAIAPAQPVPPPAVEEPVSSPPASESPSCEEVISEAVETPETVAGELQPDCPQPACPPNQLWLLSTRCLPGCVPALPMTPQVWRNNCGNWVGSSLAQLLAGDDPRYITVVYAHGNDVRSEVAERQGAEFYDWIAQKSCCCAPIRFIVWSWPSNYVVGSFRNDARTKYCRTNVEPFYLASFLDQMRPDLQVVLIGYSFGARISTGALHLLGGGAINNRVLPQRIHPIREPLGVVLLAGAVGRDSLIPGHRHGMAMSQVRRMWISVNSTDRVLRYFPKVLEGTGTDALGYTGPSGLNLMGADRSKIYIEDVSAYVHKHHGFSVYLRAGEVMAKARREVLTALPLVSPPSEAPPPMPVEPVPVP